MEAIDPLTAQKKWRTPLMDFQIWSAMLATGGSLLFTGKETGEFIAVDADTGEIVWQFQTGSGINAVPVTLHAPGSIPFPPDQRERFVNAVTRGKNQMPPWGDFFKPDQLQALWAYVAAGER